MSDSFYFEKFVTYQVYDLKAKIFSDPIAKIFD